MKTKHQAHKNWSTPSKDNVSKLGIVQPLHQGKVIMTKFGICMAACVKMEVAQGSKVWPDPMGGVFGVHVSILETHWCIAQVLGGCADLKSRCQTIPCQKRGRHEDKTPSSQKLVNPIQRQCFKTGHSLAITPRESDND